MTKSTVSKHWRKAVDRRDQAWIPPEPLYHVPICQTQSVGPVRTAHISVLSGTLSLYTTTTYVCCSRCCSKVRRKRANQSNLCKLNEAMSTPMISHYITQWRTPNQRTVLVNVTLKILTNCSERHPYWFLLGDIMYVPPRGVFSTFMLVFI